MIGLLLPRARSWRGHSAIALHSGTARWTAKIATGTPARTAKARRATEANAVAAQCAAQASAAAAPLWATEASPVVAPLWAAQPVGDRHSEVGRKAGELCRRVLPKIEGKIKRAVLQLLQKELCVHFRQVRCGRVGTVAGLCADLRDPRVTLELCVAVGDEIVHGCASFELDQKPSG